MTLINSIVHKSVFISVHFFRSLSFFIKNVTTNTCIELKSYAVKVHLSPTRVPWSSQCPFPEATILPFLGYSCRTPLCIYNHICVDQWFSKCGPTPWGSRLFQGVHKVKSILIIPRHYLPASLFFKFIL